MLALLPLRSHRSGVEHAHTGTVREAQLDAVLNGLLAIEDEALRDKGIDYLFLVHGCAAPKWFVMPNTQIACEGRGPSPARTSSGASGCDPAHTIAAHEQARASATGTPYILLCLPGPTRRADSRLSLPFLSKK